MYFDSPVGTLAIRFAGSAVCELNFLDKFADRGDVKLGEVMPLIHQLTAQLQNYFSVSNSSFSIPLVLRGTDFQRRVWDALQQIPVGEVRTYGQLAEQLHSSARAVGNACRHNPTPIIVPCHRVVSASGLGGFCGQTEGAEVRRKYWLLSHEGIELPMPSVA